MKIRVYQLNPERLLKKIYPEGYADRLEYVIPQEIKSLK